MAKTLEDGFFDPDTETFQAPIPKVKGRIDTEYLSRRTQMFISMTQGRGKPMQFGVQKKDKSNG